MAISTPQQLADLLDRQSALLGIPHGHPYSDLLVIASGIQAEQRGYQGGRRQWAEDVRAEVRSRLVAADASTDPSTTGEKAHASTTQRGQS